MSDPKQGEETYSEEETVRRREAALKRMLATPHKPQKPLGAKRKPNLREPPGMKRIIRKAPKK